MDVAVTSNSETCSDPVECIVYYIHSVYYTNFTELTSCKYLFRT